MIGHLDELLNSFMENMEKERIEKSAILTIGDLLDKLNTLDKDKPIILSNGWYLRNKYDSYRGYYTDLALGHTLNEDKDSVTVSTLTKLLEKALLDKIMYGYKGGEYRISDDTIIWVSNYGMCSNIGISDVKEVDGVVILATFEED